MKEQHPLAHLTKKHMPIPESHPLELYEIMGEPHELWATLTKKKEIEVIVTNENDEVVFKEITTDIAWDELVYFAKQILSCNERIERMKQIKEQE